MQYMEKSVQEYVEEKTNFPNTFPEIFHSLLYYNHAQVL